MPELLGAGWRLRESLWAEGATVKDGNENENRHMGRGVQGEMAPGQGLCATLRVRGSSHSIQEVTGGFSAGQQF